MNVVINACLDRAPEGSSPRVHHGDYYHHLLSCLGYAVSEPPTSDLLRQLHGLDGTWLVVSPLHWLATHHDAMIVAVGDDLQFTEGEGRAWFEAFTDFVRAEDMRTYYHDACTWLIQINDQPKITAKPVRTLLHQSMMQPLESLDKTLFWQRFITESQMFLSAHGLNRLRQNRCSINGLWIWGAGILHVPSQRMIVVDDDDTLALATLLSTNVVLHVRDQTYPPDTLLIWHDLNRLDDIQHTLSKQTVSWYWNNQAYVMKPKHGWRRLWR